MFFFLKLKEIMYLRAEIQILVLVFHLIALTHQVLVRKTFGGSK